MKSKDLIILAGIAAGAFFLYQYFKDRGIPGGGISGGRGGGLINGNGKPGSHHTAVVPSGSVIQQVAVPGITYDDPRNLVLTQPDVRSGDITVIPAMTGAAYTQAPQQPVVVPPLNIQTILGFPVVPKLQAPAPAIAPQVQQILSRTLVGSALLQRVGY